MSNEKSYGQIACETFHPSLDWAHSRCHKSWEKTAEKVIAEYERRNPPFDPGPEVVGVIKELRLTNDELRKQVAYLTDQLHLREEKLPSVERIAQILWENGHTWCDGKKVAQAVLDLLQAKTMNKVQTREEELQADLDERRAKDVDSILKKLDNENQGESEEQYQSRLLRALRSFG